MHIRIWPYHEHTYTYIWCIGSYKYRCEYNIYNRWPHDFGIIQLKKRKWNQTIWTEEKSSEWVDLHSQSCVQLAPKKDGFGRFITPFSFHGFKFQRLNSTIVQCIAINPWTFQFLRVIPQAFQQLNKLQWWIRFFFSFSPDLVIRGAARLSTIFAPKAWISWAMIHQSRKVPCQGQQVSKEPWSRRRISKDSLSKSGFVGFPAVFLHTHICIYIYIFFFWSVFMTLEKCFHFL